MPESGGDPNIERYTTERMLSVALPVSERVEKAVELANVTIKLRRLDREYTKVKSEYNSRLKYLQSQAEGIAEKIENGSQELVSVDVFKDHTHNLIVETRSDTDEKITNRAMTAKDRQAEIPSDDGGEGVHNGDTAGDVSPEEDAAARAAIIGDQPEKNQAPAD